jgi:hypothetical protein
MDGELVPPIATGPLELLAPWYSQNGRDSRTLELFDAIPKYPFPTTRFVERAERVEAAFTVHGRRYLAEILPAQIKLASGEERLAFPGGREELVERALRFLAVQQLIELRIIPNGESGTRGILVRFTLSSIRRHLEELGHGYKLTEIKEALDILRGTRIRIRDMDAAAKGRQVFEDASILMSYAGDFAEGDPSGEDSRIAVLFHPRATQAIFEMAYWPISQARVGELKMPLARWLTTRMSHNFRQAQKRAYVDGAGGYHIKLSTILAERGLVREKRLRDNVDAVRGALKEMVAEKILDALRPFEESLEHAATRGRPQIKDAVWVLYPSSEFVEEIIRGNVEMARARQLETRGNKRESP